MRKKIFALVLTALLSLSLGLSACTSSCNDQPLPDTGGNTTQGGNNGGTTGVGDGTNPGGNGGEQGGTTTPDPDEGEQGGTTTPDPDEGEQGGTTIPDPDEGEQGGTTTPDPDEGEQGGTTTPDPDEGEQGGTTTPDPDEGEKGGTTTPDPDEGEQGGTTTPDPDEGEQGGTTTPDPDEGEQGGTTTPDPDEGEQGGTTTPDPDEGEQGGTTTPDPDEGEEGGTITPDPDEGEQGGTTTPDPDEGEQGGTTTPDPDPQPDPNPGGSTGGGTGSGSQGGGTTIPAEGAVQIISAEGSLESAYITWEIDQSFAWYNVYYKANGASDSAYVLIDAPLVRQYSDYMRADIIGLAAGEYDILIVPVDENGQELEEYSTTVENIAVEAHDRSGFAFVNGTSSGAYNDDGTLKSNAYVIYITEQTKNTVTLNVVTSSKGAITACTGLQAILNAYKKGYETHPLSVRLIGNITDLAEMDKGDIVIDEISVGVTFEGIGSDATANGWGLRIKNSSNVEVRNLGFMNCDSSEGDNIGLQQKNDHVWVHNCDLFYGDAGSDADQAKGDGALDTKTSTYVTHSYNHFWDSGKSNLQGMKSETTENYITYHHNWYDHSDSRHPRIRTCTVHVYNNYFDGNSKYGVGATMGSSVFVENNYFRSTTTLKPMLSSKQGTDAQGDGTFSGENGGIIKSYGNEYDASDVRLITYQQNSTSFDVYEASSRDEVLPSTVKTLAGGTTYNNFDTSAAMYDYSVDTPEEAKAKVEKYAGRVGGGDFKYDFDDEKEDGNYDVISQLKTLLVNYQTDLVKVGGEQAGSTGGNTGGGEQGGTITPDPDEGEQGGSEQGGSTVVPVEDAAIVTFDGGEYDYKKQSTIAISGKTSTSKGSVTFNGVTYTTCLKIESSTAISFSIGEDMTLGLYFPVGEAGKCIKVDGQEYTANSNGVVEVQLKQGAHTISKSDVMNLFVIVLSPVN